MLLYATVPGFYAEVERGLDGSLAERPVIVGGDPRKGGLVQAATADAVGAGVEAGMSVLEALERCPHARACRTNMRRYRAEAFRLRACFRRHTARVEPAGLESAYLDGSQGDAVPEILAARLRDQVAEELDLPLRVGVAPVKFLAKLAAEESGREGVFRVDSSDVSAFLGPLLVGRLPGVGPRTVARLGQLSTKTVADVLALGRESLEAEFGNHGISIWGYAQGRDSSCLRAAPHPRSLSHEATLSSSELDLASLEELLQELSQRLESSLALERLAAKRVILKVRWADGEQTSRSRTLVRPVASARELFDLAGELLARTQAGTRPVRGLALAVGELARSRRDDRQLDLFNKST
jgi:nucleotidyltransferase/DNA polymerase involved in DNA repair